MPHAGPTRPVGDAAAQDPRRRRRLALGLALLGLLGVLAGLATGADGFAPRAAWAGLQATWTGPADAADAWGSIVTAIRAPRTLGALAIGGLLGCGGAIAQGLFRNPLADPYLLGSASGAGLGVVLVLALASAAGGTALAGLGPTAPLLQTLLGLGVSDLGLVLAAWLGAVVGVTLTLALAGGAAQTLRLLLAGVVVGVVLGAGSDLITVVSPEALRGKQAFLLGSTAYLGWPAVGGMALALPLLVLAARRGARVLDALTLGEDTALSLGVSLGRWRLLLVALLCAATALAVAQAGLVGFVGLVAPHLVRRHAPGPHRWLVTASTAMGAVLLLWADVLARAVVAPQELPVGVVTALLGGGYLCLMLRRGALR